MSIFEEHKIFELKGNWRAVRGGRSPDNSFAVRNICVNASLLASNNDDTFLFINASADWDIYHGYFLSLHFHEV